MARLHIHPVGLALIFFGFLVWIVALGGLSAVTYNCYHADTGSDETPASFCSRTYQLEWWSVWFEFFLLVVMLATCFLNAFERARFIYLTYLSLVTSLLTIASRNFITTTFLLFKDSGSQFNYKDTKQSSNNAAAAGTIMICIVNYALIIFIGLGAAAQQAAGQAVAAPEQKYAPATF
mmetsp:Transcript_11391/g.24481  ORF Transcript_11391/g.24481 Transcript_11391/m.24481 type:complete len:178 (-) Transcript_11391:358-891(-)